MTFERRFGSIFCLVGVLLLLILTGPLANTRQVPVMWWLGVLGGAVAIGAGGVMIATGKARDSRAG